MYNLSVYSLGTGEATFYMWDEIVAKKGACEVASCLMMYIRQLANQGSTSLVLCADNYVRGAE